ncbi:MAG: MATE family efflux transporter [Prevotella sp.]|nr:MATE family efflux transporter [Prevotella sp.]
MRLRILHDRLCGEILRLAIPSVISNVTVPLLGLVDLMIVGHIGNETYISAIAVGSMIFNVIYWLLGFLRMGTSGMTAQAYGRADGMACISVLFRTLTIGIVLGILFVLCQRGIEWGMLRLMGTPNAARELVAEYFRIVVWGAPAMLGLYGLTGWFVGMQDTRTPMMVAVIQNVLNIIVSLFCVFSLGWSIQGVAAGTLFAQWAGFLMAVVAVRRCVGRSGLSLHGQDGKSLMVWDFGAFLDAVSVLSVWKDFFSVNRDIFLRTLCLVITNMFFTRAGGQQGAMMLAVNTLLMTLFTLFSYVMDGFAYAGEALSGRYYGAADWVRLRGTVRRLFGFGAVMVVLFSVVYVLGGVRFLSLLTDDSVVVRSAVPYLPWAYLIPVTGVAAFVFDGIFIGLTDTKGMLVSSFSATVVFFILYEGLHASWGNDALWIAFLSFLSVRGLAAYVWYRLFPPII